MDFQRLEKIRNMLILWSDDNLRDFPWRRKTNPYSILIAEVLLKRTTSKAVYKIYDAFIEKYPSIQIIKKTNEKELKGLLKLIGYQNKRAKELKIMADYICNKYDGVIPSSYDELISIPYVGSYTAGAIMSQIYDKKRPMMDSNVERIIKRLFINSMNKCSHQKKVMNEIMEKILPNYNIAIFNLTLIDFGALICKYQNPKCHCCPLFSFCDSVKNKAKYAENNCSN